MRPYLLLGIALLLMSANVMAATISGTVYDISLQKLNNVVVEVNSNPQQRDITEMGEYKFNVGSGSYIISAGLVDSGELRGFTQENIVIIDDGDYLLDLILFPDLSVEDELANENIELGVEELEERQSNYWVIGVVLVLLCIIIFLFRMNRNARKINKEFSQNRLNEESDIANDILNFIKKEGGRTTQLDIRKQFPSSEAKISLVITELEDEGKVKRIKKGRGNVIILG